MNVILCIQDVFGSLQATAVSSGYCIGSCNWVLQSAHEKVTSSLNTEAKELLKSVCVCHSGG